VEKFFGWYPINLVSDELSFSKDFPTVTDFFAEDINEEDSEESKGHLGDECTLSE
jgi:hypothetical protein